MPNPRPNSSLEEAFSWLQEPTLLILGTNGGNLTPGSQSLAATLPFILGMNSPGLLVAYGCYKGESHRMLDGRFRGEYAQAWLGGLDPLTAPPELLTQKIIDTVEGGMGSSHARLFAECGQDLELGATQTVVLIMSYNAPPLGMTTGLPPSEAGSESFEQAAVDFFLGKRVICILPDESVGLLGEEEARRYFETAQDSHGAPLALSFARPEELLALWEAHLIAKSLPQSGKAGLSSRL